MVSRRFAVQANRMAKLTTSNTYTDEELLALYREAIAQLSVAQTYRLDGVEYTRAQLPHLRKVVEWLESRIAVASGRQAHNTARFGRQR